MGEELRGKRADGRGWCLHGGGVVGDVEGGGEAEDRREEGSSSRRRLFPSSARPSLRPQMANTADDSFAQFVDRSVTATPSPLLPILTPSLRLQDPLQREVRCRRQLRVQACDPAQGTAQARSVLPPTLRRFRVFGIGSSRRVRVHGASGQQSKSMRADELVAFCLGTDLQCLKM